MAKRIEYNLEGFLCKDKCPHKGYYIGSIFCFKLCPYNDHSRTPEQMKEEIRTGKRIVLCNHPKWVDN